MVRSDPTTKQKPKWYLAHSEQLRGADIVVFNDNDMPGYAHADAVCKLFSRHRQAGAPARSERSTGRRFHRRAATFQIGSRSAASTRRRSCKALIEAAPDYVPMGTPKPEPSNQTNGAPMMRTPN